ncbi:MAG: PEP-CTERM sorting domain-containing protein [Verrucomicrobiales bacterium]|jgi:autotransporter-associated beta strand protein|nr:PEP-CTERM sorting domain-containing protein [Verrucomicrobiales bacterium]
MNKQMSSIIKIGLAVFLSVITCNISFAVTGTWNSAAVSSDFEDTANWVSGTKPANSTANSEVATFDGDASTIINPNLTMDRSIGSINFNTTGWTLGGTNYTLTINNGIGIANNASVTGTVNIETNINLGTGTGQQTFNAFNGTLYFSGSIIGTAGIFNRTGVMILSGNNSFAGGVTAGNLGIASATALGTGTFSVSRGTFDNASGGALTLTTNNNINFGNQAVNFVGTNSLVMGTGTAFLTGNNSVTVQNNKLTIGTLSAATNTFTKAGAGTMVINRSIGTGSFVVSAGTLEIDSQLITLSGISSNKLNATGTGVFKLGSLSFDLTNADLTNGNTWSIWGSATTNWDLSSFQLTGWSDSGGQWAMANGQGLWSFNQSTGILSFSAIPEPSTWTLMGIGAGLLVWVGYRKRKANI